jgi:very-short-patch-repair endonuclease
VILGRPDDLPIAMSHPELELARALEDRDPRWQRQFPIEFPGSHTIHIDVARPDIKLGVEVDGELHDTVVAIHRDKLRDMQAALLGWQILRPTTADVTEHLMEVISMISRTVTQRTMQFKVA